MPRFSDKSDEEFNLIQNLRPIILRVVFLMIFTVIFQRQFASSLERTGTIDEEQQGSCCKRSARRAAHSLQNILWDANRERRKIAVLSLYWQNFFGSTSQEAFLLVVDSIGFSEEDVALLRAFYKDTSLRVPTDGG